MHVLKLGGEDEFNYFIYGVGGGLAIYTASSRLHHDPGSAVIWATIQADSLFSTAC
jgi:hypothetical protein